MALKRQRFGPPDDRGFGGFIVSLFKPGLLSTRSHLDRPKLDGLGACLAGPSGDRPRWTNAGAGRVSHIREDFNLVPGQPWRLAEGGSSFQDAVKSAQLQAMHLYLVASGPDPRSEGTGTT